MLQRATLALLLAFPLALPGTAIAEEDEKGAVVEKRTYVEEDGTVVIEETTTYRLQDDDGPGPLGSAPAPAPGGGGISEAEASGILQRHNTARAEVGVAPLVWSDEIAAHAQQWADELASTRSCDLVHSTANRYGENLAGGSEPYDPVALWYTEKPLYTGGPFDESTLRAGHYTQVVWRDTARVGCGKARCGADSVVVCNYDPAGNTLGQKPY